MRVGVNLKSARILTQYAGKVMYSVILSNHYILY